MATASGRPGRAAAAGSPADLTSAAVRAHHYRVAFRAVGATALADAAVLTRGWALLGTGREGARRLLGTPRKEVIQ